MPGTTMPDSPASSNGLEPGFVTNGVTLGGALESRVLVIATGMYGNVVFSDKQYRSRIGVIVTD